MDKIPFHIISGFLGSGKTTFLKRIIGQYADRKKIGIIQNEFAPSNIDSVVLRKSEADFHLLEINNGSVFCVCLLGEFTRSMENFIDKYQPDIVIIEASGLSDTTSISEVISAGNLSNKVFLASNWCIVDAENYTRSGLMKQRVLHQIRMADRVVINKTDLVKDGILELEEELRKINPFATVLRTEWCNIDFELGTPAIPKFYMGEMQTLPRPDINSMVIKSTRKITEESLNSFLKLWASKAYRIKGYVNLKEGKTVAVQCTFDSIQTEVVESDLHPTELIALSDRFTLSEWYRSYKQFCGKGVPSGEG